MYWNPHVLEGVFQLASLRTATAKLSCHCEPQIEVSVISNNVPFLCRDDDSCYCTLNPESSPYGLRKPL